MRFCPTCDSEYRDSVTTCADDGAALLDRPAYEAELARQGRQPIDHRELVPVATFFDRFEADELSRDLADEGLHVWLVRNKTPVVGMLAPEPMSWNIVVPEREAAQATALLAEWRPALEGSQTEAAEAAEREVAASEHAPLA